MSFPKADIVRGGGLSADQLRGAVRGREPTVSQASALFLLAGRLDVKDRHLDFQAVLEDQHAPQAARCFAAMHLGGLASPDARAILERNLGIDDALVLGRVMRSLALIGDAGLLPRFAAIAAKAQGWLVHEATWAARLLAHRVGARGHEVDAPQAFLPVAKGAARDLVLEEADDGDRSALQRSFALQPPGMNIAWDRVSRLRCGPRTMFLVLNPDVLARWHAGEGRDTCSVAAIVVHQQDARAHTPLYYLLTCPAHAGGGAVLSLWTAKGRLVFAGDAARRKEAIDFAIRGVDDFGVVPVDLDGTVALDKATAGRVSLGRKESGTGVARRRPADRT